MEQNPTDVVTPSQVIAGRPSTLKMNIHTGMLESMGHNMYTSIAKSLVEFVANGYDAEAKTVSISIPFDEIDKERKKLREVAKKDVEAGKRDKWTALYDPLPPEVEISVSDNGHGMSAAEVEKKFLLVNRNRRDHTPKSESNLRYVMGRKGLGKLAGFGAAERIKIWTKRAGETYATVFTMDFNQIKLAESMSEVTFTPTYEENLPSDDKGTIVTMSALRCDAMKSKEETIAKTLAQNFLILGDDFTITLNGQKVTSEEVDYEFNYPDNGQLDAAGFAEKSVSVEGILDYPIRYVVKFRARESDVPDDKKGDGKKRGHLQAKLRGARIYCNGRLAAGPTLLNLHSGMHNFHSQSYMECLVHADELDRHNIDHISTNRTDLKTDNEVVDALIDAVTDIMKEALKEHAKFRESKAEEQVEKDEFSKGLMARVQTLPKRTRDPAKKILKVIAGHAGVQSELYKEVAPVMLQAMNAGEVLTRLIELGADPKSIATVAEHLAELSKVEASDVLKHYRGRRSGIEALNTLQERADAAWGGPKFESDLHRLLKENPWLVRNEYDRYLTSDKPLSSVAKKLDQALDIDTVLPPENPVDQKKRPDLVFVLVNEDSPDTVSIVELKSPNIPLTLEHLTQLEGYMLLVKEILRVDYAKNDVRVTGHLIGNLPKPDTQILDEKMLLDKLKSYGPTTMWEIISVPQLLHRAKITNTSLIEALEEEEKRLEDDLK